MANKHYALSRAELEIEIPIAKLDRLSTSSTEYLPVVTWTVSTNKRGILASVEVESDNYAKTRFRLIIAGEEKFTDKEILQALSLDWPNVRLAAGTVVLLEAKASEAIAINVDGAILGKEVG